MFRSIQGKRRSSTRELFAITIFMLIILVIIFICSTITEEVDEFAPIPNITDAPSVVALSSNHSHITSNEQRVRRLPQAIIIGSRKSGTRALLKFLEVNPAIRAAHNEVHFFDKPQNYKLGFDWYRSQMPESSSQEVTIEKSPAYFVTRDVPQRVKAMNSSIKLILIFRDPVIRLISDFSQIVANKMEPSEDEEDNGRDYSSNDSDEHFSEHSISIANNSLNNSSAVRSFWEKAEDDFIDYVVRFDGGIDEHRRAIKIGMYSNYLERWKAMFPIKQFHFVNGETLISNPYEELHKLELFLGLKPIIRQEDFVFNKRKGFFCLSSNTSAPRYNQEGFRVVHFGKDRSGDESPKQARHETTVPSCLSRSKGRRHVKVKEKLLEDLRKFYAPYNEYLYTLVGQNFNWSTIK